MTRAHEVVLESICEDFRRAQEGEAPREQRSKVVKLRVRVPAHLLCDTVKDGEKRAACNCCHQDDSGLDDMSCDTDKTEGDLPAAGSQLPTVRLKLTTKFSSNRDTGARHRRAAHSVDRPLLRFGRPGRLHLRRAASLQWPYRWSETADGELG